jgi:mannose/cellobiose epimerase-like protein (N-acyl-D-glucosamine 2-epimerase family)
VSAAGAPQEFAQVRRLLDFAKQSAAVDKGFGYLDNDGAVDTTLPPSVLTTSRMTFSFSIGSELGIEGSLELAQRGVASLLEDFYDPDNGGFRSALRATPGTHSKSAYDTAFVLLASSSAYALGVDEGKRVAELALETLLDRFWREDLGIFANSFNDNFSVCEPYLGANANMHSVEALMAASTALQDPTLLDRAHEICRFMVDTHAREAGWLMPEHYDTEGQPLWEFNAATPDDEFRPFGVTIGHLFEWSRLLMELCHSGVSDSAWMPGAARSLYETARKVGWAPDGKPGFVYTLDWKSEPIITERLMWVLAEAICAAAEMEKDGVVDGASDNLAQWQDLLAESFVDTTHGSWHHQLDPDGRPSSSIARGKPDAYHLIQALLASQLPQGAGILERLRGR